MSFSKAAGRILGCCRSSSILLSSSTRQCRYLSFQQPVAKFAPGGCFSATPIRNFAEIKPEPIAQQKQEEQSKEQGDSKGNENDEKKWYSAWTGKNVWKLGALSMSISLTMTGAYILFEWGAPMVDIDGNEIVDEFTSLPAWQQYPLRAWREMKQYQKMIRDPVSEKLLPDPLQEPYFQPPYTLVIELMGVLVHPDWSYKTGWRFRKRPGLDYLLKSCAYPLFEVVIFTQEPPLTAHPLIDSLDSNQMVMYRLYRESTRYEKGVHIKDLSCLNRDLSKVIFIDWDEKTGQLQPRNMLPLKKWKGEDNDATLVDLTSFLRTLALSGVEDVRPVLEYYRQFDDPLFVFRENQRKLAAVAAEKQKQPATSHSLPTPSTASSWSPWRR